MHHVQHLHMISSTIFCDSLRSLTLVTQDGSLWEGQHCQRAAPPHWRAAIRAKQAQQQVTFGMVVKNDSPPEASALLIPVVASHRQAH